MLDLKIFELQTGVQSIEQAISNSGKDDTNKLLKQVASLLQENAQTNPQSILDEIKALFEAHWKSIENSSNTYLLNNTSENESWVNFSMQLAEMTHQNYYDYLIPESIRKAEKTIGHFPREILSTLQKLLKIYFDAGEKNNFSSNVADYPELKVELSNLIGELKNCYTIDIHFLYSFRLHREKDEPEIFFSDVLLRCLFGKMSGIKDQMIRLARSIAAYDPSVLVNHSLLQGIYQEQCMGDFFTAEKLLSFVPDLTRSESPTIKEMLRKFSERLKSEGTISDSIVQELKLIYQQRWHEIKDKRYNYTSRFQADHNYWWIRVSQFLSGAKKISWNYYRFLIPTLEHDNDNVSKYVDYRVTEYPLTHYIVSEDEKRLISLNVSAMHCHGTKTFYDCSGVPQPFSEIEYKRLKFSDPRFDPYLMEYVFYKPQPLSRDTINLVEKLVNDTLDKNGLEHRVDQERLRRAEIAYTVFFATLEEWLKDEKKKGELDIFLKHRVLMLDPCHTNFSVEEVINKIKSRGQDGCIAVCGRFFAQLVLNYAPWIKFIEDIETSFLIGPSLMRENSAKLVFSEYNWLDRKEAYRRNIGLIVSLFRFKFDVSCFNFSSSKSMSLFDLTNSTEDDFIWELWNLVKETLENPLSMDSRHLYVHLIEGKIMPVRANPSSLSPKAKEWVNQINVNTLAVEGDAYYDLKAMYVRLSSLSHHYQVKTFLSEIIYTQQQKYSEMIKLIRIHVKLADLFDQLGPILRNRVETLLKHDVPNAVRLEKEFDTLVSQMVSRPSSLNPFSIFNRVISVFSSVEEYPSPTP